MWYPPRRLSNDGFPSVYKLWKEVKDSFEWEKREKINRRTEIIPRKIINIFLFGERFLRSTQGFSG